jgi:hypothetical protein
MRVIPGSEPVDGLYKWPVIAFLMEGDNISAFFTAAKTMKATEIQIDTQARFSIIMKAATHFNPTPLFRNHAGKFQPIILFG